MDQTKIFPDEIHVYLRTDGYWCARGFQGDYGISKKRSEVINIGKDACIINKFKRMVIHREDDSVSLVIRNFKKPNIRI